MLKLFIERPLSTPIWQELDLYEFESFNWTMQWSDLENIQSPAGSFSQAFKLPFSDTNLAYFGFLDKAGTIPEGTENGDPGTTYYKKRFKAGLGRLSGVYIPGYLQVKGVTIVNGVREFDVVFFGETLNMSKKIGQGFISELDLSALNEELNYNNIVSSWALGAGNASLRYGIIDKGFNWNFTTNPPWTDADGLWQSEFTPFVRLRDIVDAIFDEAGLTYVSDFFDTTDFKNIMMPAYNGEPTPLGTDSFLNDASVALPTDQSPLTATKLNLSDAATNAIDEGANWDNTNDEYTAPEDAFYRVTIVYSYYRDPGDTVTIELRKNGVLEETLFTPTATGNVVNLSESFELFLNSGDTLALYASVTTASSSVRGNNTVGTGRRTEMRIEAGRPVTGYDIDIAANLPKLKKMDLMTSLQKMFNLVFIPSGVPDQIIIEPYDDYFDTSDEVDWTSRVHRDKTIALKPTTDIQAKEYEWTYREGLDFISDIVEKRFDRVYGAHQVLDPDNDFATGEKKIETALGNFVTSLIPGSSIVAHRSLQSDGQAVKDPLPMLAYWNGMTTATFTFRDDANANVTSTGYPTFTPYSDDYATVTSNDLNFGIEASLIPIQANPVNTLYWKYWNNYVQNLYSETSRILECTVRFETIDMITWNWNTKVFIDDTYYRILSISTDLNGDNTARIVALKYFDEWPGCGDEVTGYDPKYNAILFNGSTAGSPDYGSQACCVQYGFDWVNTVILGVGRQICRPTLQTLNVE
jgi:hypothetical protein